MSSRDLLFDQQRVDLGAAIIKSLTNKRDEIVTTLNSINADADKAKPGTPEAQEAVERAKQEQAEILSLQNTAQNSELSGIALLENLREQAISAFEAKYGASQKAMDAINTDYRMKEIAAWNQQWEEADKAMRMAQQAAQQQAGTGNGSIEDEHQNTLADINNRATSLGANRLNPQAAATEREAADLTADTHILAAHTEFEKQMQQISTHADDAQITGYARIADEAAKSYQKIREDLKTLDKAVGASSPNGQKGQSDADSEELAVYGNMLREMEQLHAKTMEQITKEEEQTARYSLPEWQQAQLKIVDAFQDRVREIETAEKQQNVLLNASMQADSQNSAIYKQAEVMAAQDADAKMLAARQQMNAQMQQSDQETRDKLASGLQSLFEHPEKFFEDRAMKTAFQMMANQMMPMMEGGGPLGGAMQYMFGMGPGMSTSRNPLTDMNSVLGHGHGHGAAGMSGTSTQSMAQFSQGSSLIQSSGETFQQAVSQFQSAVSRPRWRGDAWRRRWSGRGGYSGCGDG